MDVKMREGKNDRWTYDERTTQEFEFEFEIGGFLQIKVHWIVSSCGSDEFLYPLLYYGNISGDICSQQYVHTVSFIVDQA
jgi:hypothetical protein